MSTAFKPRVYQDLATAFLLENKRCALWSSMGTGKTVSTLTALDALYLSGESRPTLVLAPSPYDAHPDHRASGILAMRIFGTRGEIDRVNYWIVHGGRAWPTPRGLHPALPQTPPPRGSAGTLGKPRESVAFWQPRNDTSE